MEGKTHETRNLTANPIHAIASVGPFEQGSLSSELYPSLHAAKQAEHLTQYHRPLGPGLDTIASSAAARPRMIQMSWKPRAGSSRGQIDLSQV